MLLALAFSARAREAKANSLASEDLFYEWLTKLWFRSNSNIKPATNTFLVMDSATTHLSKHILDLFKENKSYYILIPPGATRNLKPLDYYK